jgi:hypothetical protein
MLVTLLLPDWAANALIQRAASGNPAEAVDHPTNGKQKLASGINSYTPGLSPFTALSINGPKTNMNCRHRNKRKQQRKSESLRKEALGIYSPEPR